jgi:DNA repair protein RecN (Recombination protein N)
MIISIHLTNFTIIDTLDLEFKSGMTVLTGETGAGKSIIIDAIQLALGARLESKVVREGCDKSTITLTFDVKDNAIAKAWLKERDLLAGDECILSRSITQEGRSRAFVNGQPTTLHSLNELGSLLINIHGQHQHQSLIKKEFQLNMLDLYGKHEKLLAEVKSIADDWHGARKHYDALLQNSQGANNRREFLQFQLTEFEKLALRDNEVEELNNEHKQLCNAENFLRNSQQAMAIITDSENSLQDQLNHCLSSLVQVKSSDDSLAAAYELLNNALVQIEEASHEIRHYQDQVDLNPERLQEIDARMAIIHNLARKHRVPAKELQAIETRLTEELNSLDNFDEKLEELQKQLTKSEQAYAERAAKLSKKRQDTAKNLSALITSDIQSLNMKGGQFSIALNQLTETTPNVSGQERAEFLAAANTGQSLQPLAKVASGGELSRISLAIQVNTSKRMQTPVLIFDEVDAGIGGATADMVGCLLQRLGMETQVFCVTHLPQVASKAQQHLKVQKTVKQGQTFTSVSLLNQNEKIHEVARMLGGLNITKESLEHAKVLLEV